MSHFNHCLVHRLYRTRTQTMGGRCRAKPLWHYDWELLIWCRSDSLWGRRDKSVRKEKGESLDFEWPHIIPRVRDIPTIWAVKSPIGNWKWRGASLVSIGLFWLQRLPTDSCHYPMICGSRNREWPRKGPNWHIIIIVLRIGAYLCLSMHLKLVS